LRESIPEVWSAKGMMTVRVYGLFASRLYRQSPLRAHGALSISSDLNAAAFLPHGTLLL